MLSSKDISFLVPHAGLLLIHGLLSLLLLLFSSRVEAVVVYWLVLVLPGYLIARMLLEEEFLCALVAFPLSIFLVGAVTAIAAWFSTEIINFVTIGVAWVIVGLLMHLNRQQWRVGVPAMEGARFHDLKHHRPTHVMIAVALLIGVGFFTYIFYLADGSLVNASPNQVNSYDKVIQLVWVSHASSLGTATLPPALHYGETDVLTTLLPPASVWPVSIFARYSGMTPWDAQHAFAALVHAFSIGLVFWMVRHIFGLRSALLTGVAVAIPYMPFLAGDMGGMYRVSMVVMLAPLLWLSFEWMMERRKNAHIWMGIWLSALMLTHPVSFILLALPVVLLARSIWQAHAHKKEETSAPSLNYFLLPIVAGIFFLAVYGFPILVGADNVFGPHSLLNDAKWVNPLEFDVQLSSLVGPILFLKFYWIQLLLAAIASGLILVSSLKKNSAIASNWKRFALMMLFLGLLTLGFNTVYYHYLSKLRSTLFFVFVVPIIVVGLSWLIGKRLDRFHAYAGIAVVLLVGVLLVSPVLGPVLEIKPKIDAISYDAIKAVRENASSTASVLGILGFYQHSHLLTDRYGDYFSESTKLSLALEGSPVGLGPYCLSGYRRKSFFELEPAPCSLKFNSIKDYDYLMADFGVINRNVGLVQAYSAQLEGLGFVPVFVNSDVAVYKNLRISQVSSP